MTDPQIAVIIPCHNEEKAIAKVVHDVRAELPSATIYVYDNNSSDATASAAAAAGAVVRHEGVKGKGNVIRRAFGDVDSDIYVLIDGDDTYDTAALPTMVETLISGPYDHVLGVRQEETSAAYRPGHSWGNRVFNELVSRLFGTPVSDMLSGYRVFSRRFVKSFPALSREFEIETEFTIHYATLRIPHAEVPVGFRDRAEGTESKLRTFRDGYKIMGLVFSLLRHEKPFVIYGSLGALSVLLGVLLGAPVIVDFANTGAVVRFPTAILASALVVLGTLLGAVGMILNGISRLRHEIARLNYLSKRSI